MSRKGNLGVVSQTTPLHYSQGESDTEKNSISIIVSMVSYLNQ